MLWSFAVASKMFTLGGGYNYFSTSLPLSLDCCLTWLRFNACLMHTRCNSSAYQRSLSPQWH